MPDAVEQFDDGVGPRVLQRVGHGEDRDRIVDAPHHVERRRMRLDRARVARLVASTLLDVADQSGQHAMAARSVRSTPTARSARRPAPSTRPTRRPLALDDLPILQGNPDVPEHLDANVLGTSLHMPHLRAHRRGSAARTDAGACTCPAVATRQSGGARQRSVRRMDQDRERRSRSARCRSCAEASARADTRPAPPLDEDQQHRSGLLDDCSAMAKQASARG